LSWANGYFPHILTRNPISFGQTIPGFAVFFVPKAKFDLVKQKGTIYEFGFKDVVGASYTFTFVGTGGNQPSQYFPGLSIPPPMKPPMTQKPVSPNILCDGCLFEGNGTAIQNENPNITFEFRNGTTFKGNTKGIVSEPPKKQ
jgi:hypothetical protein